MMLTCRLLLGLAALVLSGFGLTLPATAQQGLTPVVFVHRNGDTVALWNTIMWRFETNGYPRDRLAAIDIKFPNARGVDDKPQEGRSSANEAMADLSAFVDAVLARTGAAKVALVGNSRGANTIRNYVKNGGGAAKVSHVVLGGGVNHGVLVSDAVLVGSEFNGASPFMKQLNDGPDEVVAGVAFMTIRSDKSDKYAQPDGMFLGMAGKPTGVSFDAPALKGADNKVIDGYDHREVSYGPKAFALMYEFITGKPAKFTGIAAEAQSLLNGRVTGVTAGAYDNVPVAGAKVDIYAVDSASGARKGPPVHSKTTGADGQWGPFKASSLETYEFVITMAGQPITHIYRSAFARGSEVIHLRPAMLGKDEDKAGALVLMTRPRGYFGHGRDTFTLDGKMPDGVNQGVPGASTGKAALPAGPQRSVIAKFNDEVIVVQTWPMADKHYVIAEFHY